MSAGRARGIALATLECADELHERTEMPTESDHDSKQWVVGVDGSESARSAARWAVANAPGRAESIALVQAWSSTSAVVYSPFEPLLVAEGMHAVQRSAQEQLAGLAGELAAASSVPITSTLAHGDPSTVLLDEARTRTQLVVGARGAGRFSRLLLGSTSARCATHATVPTVVIREHFEQPPPPVRHLVVGFDGSEHATAAVDWACGFASPGSTVDIVAVWEFTPSLFSGDVGSSPDAAERARQHLDDQVADLPASARRADIAVNTHFVQGRPREVLSTRASEADLLVVGVRGRGAIGAALLGSVSTWLLHHVDRPVAVIP
jgi:nucleotide-binding universal stress UspA family protein